MAKHNNLLEKKVYEYLSSLLRDGKTRKINTNIIKNKFNVSDKTAQEFFFKWMRDG
jgi:hypothetical protein